MTALREGTVALPDGRRLGFAEYGRRDGRPVLLFHGLPGGRAYELDRASLLRAGVRLLTLERPGIGLSDRHAGGTLMDWPTDVAVLTDAFGLDRFAVLAFSAGAPFALACGYALPERVATVGLVCGAVSFVHEQDLDDLLPESDAADLTRYRANPEQFLAERLEQVRRRCASWARDPDRFFEKRFGPVVEFWGRPRSHWLQLLAATYGRTPDVDDLADLAIDFTPWGFDVEKIQVPIHAWHGEVDDRVPVALVEELCRRAPHARLTIYPNEGHFVDWAHTDDYLDALTDW